MPVALFGAAAARYRTPAVDLARIFSPDTLGDPTTRGVARRAYHNAAVFASRAGDPRRAAELEERGLLVEDDRLYRIAAARYRLAAGDDRLALGHLDRAPATAAALALRGVIAARAGLCAEAAELFDRALALDPGEPDAVANKAKLGTCK